MTCQIITSPRLVDALNTIIDYTDDYKDIINKMMDTFNRNQLINDDDLDQIIYKLTDDLPSINGVRSCDEQINYHMNLCTLQQCIIDLYGGLFEPFYIRNRNIGVVGNITKLRTYHGAIVFEVDGVRVTYF